MDRIEHQRVFGTINQFSSLREPDAVLWLGSQIAVIGFDGDFSIQYQDYLIVIDGPSDGGICHADEACSKLRTVTATADFGHLRLIAISESRHKGFFVRRNHPGC